jgi:DNA-binding SARP family transcriptional activator/pimeloyl-ACP methyl ester carboxylesterase
MEFRILGPLEADDGGQPVQLGGAKQRALLADLLVNAGRTVAREQLIDDLWGERVPATAAKMVHVYVARLRKVLPNGLLRTQPPGYAIEPEREALDLHRFERLATEGRNLLEAGDAESAAHRLREALALWRGPALAEFGEPFAIAESERLEELRLAALEGRIEADLALGRHSDVIGELEWLVTHHPYRESLRAQQMLALYRSGRQTDALRTYRETRRLLVEEIGIEPSPALRELERRILAQDAGLAAAGEVPQKASPGRGGRRPPVRYARSADLNIAYQVSGAGPLDLVLVSGFISHLEKDWEDPRHARFFERLGSFSRLIRFDKRGTGLSDRPGDLPDLETRMDDVRAVMDAVGSERAALFGYSEGAPMSLLFTARYPERVGALVLYGAFAARTPSDDYPWAPAPTERAAYAEQIEREWGWEADMHSMCPNADPAMARWWGERARAAASPGAARALIAMNSSVDVRHVLAEIRAPTLVLHRTGDLDARVEEGRYIAERIAGARFVELAGEDHFVAIDPDQIVDEVESFLRDLDSPRGRI